MRRFVLGGIFIELAILIVGLTWVRPLTEGGDDALAAPGVQAAVGEASSGSSSSSAGPGRVVEVRLEAVETVQEIAPDVKYHVWTFGGTAPGPVIRVREGDTVRFTLENQTSLALSHSIDFHAAQTPWDVDYQPVAPGDSFSFDWVARFPGVFMYHCGVPPVLHHIANGMYGAIIVEPRAPLPAAREYVLVSSEFYPGEKPVDGLFEGDAAVMESGDPGYVVFNGGANRYLDAPLVARPGELIRLWVMNAGPTLRNAFHVIGALFDHVYPDGNPTNGLNGIQTWDVPPGGGALFELRIPDPGIYPFVTHSFAYTGRGAVGAIKVSADAPPAPGTYPTMADPFDGGIAEFAARNGTVGTGGTTGHGSSESSGAETGGEASDAITMDATITGFDPASLDVKEGKVTITYVNLDPMVHDFTIDELGVHVPVDPDETTTFTFEATPGVYTFYCSVPGHREAGMEGTVTVLPGTGH